MDTIKYQGYRNILVHYFPNAFSDRKLVLNYDDRSKKVVLRVILKREKGINLFDEQSNKNTRALTTNLKSDTNS